MPKNDLFSARIAKVGLTVEELQLLLDCCPPHLKPVVLVAVHTGMRKGEILKLKWDQVDIRHSFLLLDETKNGERREIPINRTLYELFAGMPRSLESEYVFVGKDGEPYGDIKRSFHTALKKAGIRDFHFHDLRHTFASHLVMAGIDLLSVKELLGHKSLQDMVGDTGFEPVTSCLSSKRSSQLS